MSAAEALKAARAAGIELRLDGGDLVLEASAPPPEGILDLLSRHKPDILALLRPSPDSWSAEDWQVFFDERAGIAEFDADLPRPEAEAHAFECCVVEWLNRHPCPSTPTRCAQCDGPGSTSAVVLPFRTEPGRHVWLHISRTASGPRKRSRSGAGCARSSESSERRDRWDDTERASANHVAG